VIDAHSLNGKEVATEIGTHRHHAVTGEAESDPRTASFSSDRERCRVKQCCAAVDESVRDPDSSRPAVRIGPVRDPGDRGTEGTGQPDRDRKVGSGRQLIATREHPDHIEHQCGGPTANWDVGQRRMQRVSQPGPIENILQLLPACPAPSEKLANGRLERIAESIQARFTSDERNECFGDHGAFLLKHVTAIYLRSNIGIEKIESTGEWGTRKP
jgi:hypothetical protein